MIDAAKYEHKDFDVLKHLLRTAAFAKKFTEPAKLDPNIYVNSVKHAIVLTKLRNAKNLARAITYHQFKTFKAKNIVKLIIKHREFALASFVIEQLNLTNISSVYEEWCIQMLK